jgi:DeoR family glycerol-3-phosphate regulon repressor
MPDITRRQADILTLMRESGRVLVEDLAHRFAVTPQTIRRDLNELCDQRRITRIHGGAMIASGVENLAYEARKLVAGAQKRLIGEAAARLIANDSSLFINIGTTTEEVARALAGHTGLLVITNNLHVANELHRHPAVEVIIAGGVMRRTDGGIVGAATIDMIRQFRPR